ncbi:MAG: bifunctional hydroxymethylpyrimidine kinase/phosphomethylpyrimidine kinase [Deltaproteobacteria bacterium]|nr:bifunctional hydroxymethylpyrimidine kinase/phosphomethylpyrimidine kinase [Deltaproteobacteria bacterium]
MAVALTIAGSDPSGGAGIQADLKTFHQFGCYGCAVVTLLTAQNTRVLKRVEVMSADIVAEQLDTLFEDIQPRVAKTGALGSAEIVDVVAQRFERHGIALVVDPVFVSKQGAELLTERGLNRLRQRLLPRARLVTPNLKEAELLSKRAIRDRQGARDAAKAIADLGVEAVLLKGGHGPEVEDAIDTLFWKGDFLELRALRIDSRNTHGVGCTLSSAIVAGLCHGRALDDAVGKAKTWLTKAISSSPAVGHGSCALNHLVTK